CHQTCHSDHSFGFLPRLAERLTVEIKLLYIPSLIGLHLRDSLTFPARDHGEDSLIAPPRCPHQQWFNVRFADDVAAASTSFAFRYLFTERACFVHLVTEYQINHRSFQSQCDPKRKEITEAECFLARVLSRTDQAI